jgi:hypothetical protein
MKLTTHLHLLWSFGKRGITLPFFLKSSWHGASLSTETPSLLLLITTSKYKVPNHRRTPAEQLNDIILPL